MITHIQRLTLAIVLVTFSVSGCALFRPAHQGCMVVDPDLRGQYVGQCQNNVAHGRGKAVGKDTYEGEFFEGQTHGQGVYIWSDGDKYVGQFNMGAVHGKGTMIIKNGTERISGTWENNQLVQ